MENDIRWKQRLNHLENAFAQLNEAVKIKNPSKVERAGLIQTFEFTFELSWNVLKDYLALKGIIVRFPRETIKEAFQTGLIKDGHIWIKMLDARNETSHAYDEKVAEEITAAIRSRFFVPITELVESLKKISDAE